MSKFEELRDKRMATATKAISLLGNLGRSNYDAAPAELRQIVIQLEEAVTDLATRYKLPPNHFVKQYTTNVAHLLQIRNGAPVDGYDRASIREGLTLMADGDLKKGYKIISKVVLRW